MFLFYSKLLQYLVWGGYQSEAWWVEENGWMKKVLEIQDESCCPMGWWKWESDKLK